MSTSQCTSCGLNRQNCRCSPPTGPVEITPSYCCSCYLYSFLFFFLVPLTMAGIGNLFSGKDTCFLEVFANSISVSNADWRIGFLAKSPVTGCKISLHTMNSRLLRGDEVISEVSQTSDSFEQLVDAGETDGPVTSVGFKNVVTPGVNGGVVWDFRVEIVARVKADTGHGILRVFCGSLPVKFMADPAGKMTGSLLGKMRRCEYLFRRDKRNRYV